MPNSVKYNLALVKMGVTPDSKFRCAKCSDVATWKDVEEREEKHTTFNIETGAPIDHYKLNLYDKRCGSLLIGAVVRKSEAE